MRETSYPQRQTVAITERLVAADGDQAHTNFMQASGEDIFSTIFFS
jgi:hypothetical protein